MTATPVQDKVWATLHEAFERVADRYGEPVVLSSLPHATGDEHPHTHFPFVLGPPGRLVALAIGLRAALPDAPLLLVGAADAVTIGTNHLLHAARRNIGMTLVLLRSDVLDADEAPDRGGVLPAAAHEQAARPLAWATALGATFVGRASLHDPDALADVLGQAVAARGFSVVGVTNDPSLPAGVLSRSDWPEFFATYRQWVANVPPAAAPVDPPFVPCVDAPARLEVRIVGLGGQGVKLAGTVLAEAAGAQGLFSTQIGDYGAATRGGASSVDVVFGSVPITYPGADHPSVRVALSAAGLPGEGVLVCDGRLDVPTGALDVPLVSLAREHTGGQLSAGIVSLGAVVAVLGWPSLDGVVAAATKKLPGRSVAGNVAALRAAFAHTRSLMEDR